MTQPRLVLPPIGSGVPLARIVCDARMAGWWAGLAGVPAEDVPPADHRLLALLWQAGHRDAAAP